MAMRTPRVAKAASERFFPCVATSSTRNSVPAVGCKLLPRCSYAHLCMRLLPALKRACLPTRRLHAAAASPQPTHSRQAMLAHAENKVSWRGTNLVAVSGDGERVQAQRHPRSFRSLRKNALQSQLRTLAKQPGMRNTDGQTHRQRLRTFSSRARDANNSNTGNDCTRMKMLWFVKW